VEEPVRIALAVTLLLAPASAVAGDHYYREFKRDPVPPVVVVEDLAAEDDGRAPACSAANEACDDPDAATPAATMAARPGPSDDEARRVDDPAVALAQADDTR
jgi:hypothetical protein